MNAAGKAAEVKNRRMILSTLWIFATLNYIYADVFTVFFLPGAQASTAAMPAGAALAFSVLMETAIAMVLLSRILKYGANRWANVIVGAVHTAAVLFFTFLGGTQPAAFSAFFAVIEIACTLVIIWYAWKWPRSEGQPAPFERGLLTLGCAKGMIRIAPALSIKTAEVDEGLQILEEAMTLAEKEGIPA